MSSVCTLTELLALYLVSNHIRLSFTAAIACKGIIFQGCWPAPGMFTRLALLSV
jgi:hypothetical protein